MTIRTGIAEMLAVHAPAVNRYAVNWQIAEMG
jgi:hypothetical protein